MQDRNSFYALNKKAPEAIVYVNDGRLVHVTKADLEGRTDFARLKAWSDENYHSSEKKQHVEDNHTVSYEGINESALGTEGPEEQLERERDRRIEMNEAYQKVAMIREVLSAKQFKRLWLYHVRELTEDEIATIESTSQQAVSKSIRRAEEKIRKIFEGA